MTLSGSRRSNQNMPNAPEQLAIFGALMLYLDFINMFLFLLRNLRSQTMNGKLEARIPKFKTIFHDQNSKSGNKFCYFKHSKFEFVSGFGFRNSDFL